MTVKTIVMAAAFTMMSSLAVAQPAPIGSSADFGNGALINRGPVRTVGEDMDFQNHRSYRARVIAHHRRHHFREYRRY